MSTSTLQPVGGAVPEGPDALQPADWTYHAEGRVHLVLRYRGDSPRFKGHVIRLIKVSEEVMDTLGSQSAVTDKPMK
jgi:hypothetical protein